MMMKNAKKYLSNRASFFLSVCMSCCVMISSSLVYLNVYYLVFQWILIFFIHISCIWTCLFIDLFVHGELKSIKTDVIFSKIEMNDEKDS